MMKEQITYGVLYRFKFDIDGVDEWRGQDKWFFDRSDAIKEAIHITRNPRCAEVRIIERRETFETLEAWRKCECQKGL